MRLFFRANDTRFSIYCLFLKLLSDEITSVAILHFILCVRVCLSSLVLSSKHHLYCGGNWTARTSYIHATYTLCILIIWPVRRIFVESALAPPRTLALSHTSKTKKKTIMSSVWYIRRVLYHRVMVWWAFLWRYRFHICTHLVGQRGKNRHCGL